MKKNALKFTFDCYIMSYYTDYYLNGINKIYWDFNKIQNRDWPRDYLC